jgi:lysosomal acid lipase/cholesteryl ester hydrolase
VESEDGYILNMFNVRKPELKAGAPVVFFMHDILDSADAFVMNGENSPAFIAAKAGYDVWTGNNRGTKFSKEHKTLDAESNVKEIRH